MTTTKRMWPQRKRCDCGSKITDHHWLCNKCWGKKAQRKYREKMSKLLRGNKKKNDKKT